MFRLDKKYKITLEDESSLQKKINFTSRVIWLILILIGFIITAGFLGMFVLVSTPMKNYLPGYLKESERTATEEQHLRLDSLVRVYEVNEVYINSILNALNPPEEKQPMTEERHPTPLSLDSLIPASEEEKQFMEYVREREKYNVTYASPAAAQTLMFGSVNKSGVISEESQEKYQAEFLLPIGGQVATVAEGKVISVATSPKAAGGYEIIIQHPKGFLSKTSRLSNILVRPGDRVASGQIIASTATNSGLKSNKVIFELWHDGDPLIPSRFIQSGTNYNHQ